jgi:hypothetical protein
MSRLPLGSSLLLVILLPTSAWPAGSFLPDPATVQRYGPAYRYPQAGWIVLHIEGEPYERGEQHGRLLAPEIAAHVRCFAAMQSAKSPSDGWKLTRTLCNALFLRRYHREFLEEMKGIADGASAAGATFDGRPIDLLDVVALNAWAEVDTLDAALEATPTGLEGIRFPMERPRAPSKPKGEHCSAFAATGPATRDGKIVFGHITMFALYPANFYNVWLDVKPAKGHRVFMQSYPAGIQSGMDYYFNDAGLLVAETTIRQTRFDATGLTVASRIRQTLQYADSIDGAVAILKEGNNGLYTNEWLLGDTKTNEIAMFELGTGKSRLWRSSKNEWFAGTEGFYWGCNNTKDLEVRLETLPGTNARPASPVFCPSDRDRTWLRLYDAHKGKMDAEFGKLAFTTPPLAAYHSLDAKVTTTDLAKELKTWALFGPPLGRTWQPTFEERQKFPEIQPLVSNPWAMLTAAGPQAVARLEIDEGRKVKDLHNPGFPRDEEDGPDFEIRGENARFLDPPKEDADPDPPTKPAWHGTLLPETDGDIWLAAAFSRYERIRAIENAIERREWMAPHGGKVDADYERLILELFGQRANYFLGARARPETSLSKIKPDMRSDAWFRVAEGKGVLLLHALRARTINKHSFDQFMDEFGRMHAGKFVSSAGFRASAKKWYQKSHEGFFNGKDVGKYLDSFFDFWLGQTGLPVLKLGRMMPEYGKEGWFLKGELAIAPAAIDPLVGQFTLSYQQSGSVYFSGYIPEKTNPGQLGFKFDLKKLDALQSITVHWRDSLVLANGGPFSVLTFLDEPEASLVVYGTTSEVHPNREAAEALQQAIRARHSNLTVPVKSDIEVTDEDLRSHHVLLIGRPDVNRQSARWQDAFPTKIGASSFALNRDMFTAPRGNHEEQLYAHPDSALIVAAENPLNRRYSTVLIAGLSGAATLRAAPRLAEKNQRHAEAMILPHRGKTERLVFHPKELTRDLREDVKKAQK